MKCYKCGKQAPEYNLYRQNKTGIKGIWACYNHKIKKIEPEIIEIVNLLN